MAVTDQPNNETESLTQPDAKGESVEQDAIVQVETDAQEASSIAAEQPSPSDGLETEGADASDGQEEQAQAAEADGEQSGEAADPVAEGLDEPVDESSADVASENAEEAVAEDAGDGAEASEDEEELKKDWYILKVQVNREDSIREALLRRIKIEEVEEFFGEIVVPTEEIAEFNKSGKRRVVKKKLYPGYILVNMAINDDTWFLVRETPGVGDFTGSAGKPTPMETVEVERILKVSTKEDEGSGQIKTAIPFRPGDRVRVKDGYFQNFEGDVETVDEANGRITVMINIFGRSTPVELEHWQVEAV